MYFTVFIWKTRQMAHTLEASVVASGTRPIVDKNY